MTDEAKLADLRYHWGDAYKIYSPMLFERWWATRRDIPNPEILRADSAAELRLAIRADYDLKRTSAAPTPGGAPTS